jgi:hypothetical protein
MRDLSKLKLDLMYKEEAQLLKKATAWLDAQPDIKVMRICDRYAKGYSDLFLCVGGIFTVLELKDDEGTSTPHQNLFIADVQRHGGIGGVCKTMGEIIKYVEEARGQCKKLMT